MTTVFEFLRSNIAADLSVALLHTLWQGMVIISILFLILKSISGNRSQWRYRLSIVSMLLVMMCWLGTFSILQYEPAAGSENQTATSKPIVNTDSPATTDNVGTTTVIKTVHQPSNSTDPETTGLGFGWFIILWITGVIVMLGRMFAALAGTVKLKRDAAEITDNALVELFKNMCARMNITQKIRFAASHTLRHPGVIGFWRPVLLVPASIISELPSEHLEAIIAHELAHIRRYDYLVNFCQMLVEAIFFFNPAVWWISRQIRIEREACCDIAGVESTGKRIGYAKVLLDQLDRTAIKGQSAVTAALTGFSDDNDSSSAERVKRIIDPQHKPCMKIGSVKLMLLLIVAGITLLGLWKTANITVAMAAKIMSPQERIEIMTEISESHGIKAFDPEGSSQVPKEDKVTLCGFVKTWDGNNIDRSAYMGIYYHTTFNSVSSNSGSMGISPEFGDSKWCWNGNTGEFSIQCNYGVIYISTSSPGYALTYAGPFILGPKEKKEDIELVLSQGYHASIMVIDDETKQAISNVDLTGGYLFRPGGYHHRINLKTDDDGIAAIEHAADINVTLTARSAGYQKTIFKDISLNKEGHLVLEMKKAQIAQGVVVSKMTSLPVADAVIRIQQEFGKNTMSHGRDYGDILATTDENGRFVIDQMPEGTTYALSIKADNYAYAFTDEISPGQEDIRIELSEPIVIKGTVTGPLDKLPFRDGKPYVPYTCSFRRKDHISAERAQLAFVTIQDQQGFFELTDIWGNGFDVGMNHWIKGFKIDETIPDEIVLNLSDPVTEDGIKYHKRKLIIEFHTTDGQVFPTGNIRLDYMDPNHSRVGYKSKLVDIIDGRVEADIVAPGEILYSIADTVGYWFKKPSGIKVDAGTAPLVIKIPVIPAGMIFGQVYNADGTDASNTMVSFDVIKKPPLLDNYTHFLDVDGKNSSSNIELETKYSIDPLPLGGIYRIIAHRDDTYVLSQEIELTEENPIHQIDLMFSEGVTVSGQILLPDGSEAAAINCNLYFSAAGGKGFSRQDRYTDTQGRFQFEHVNPDVDGTYRIDIKSNKDYRPVEIKLKNKDLSKPIEIILEQGTVVTGQVIDKKTGWPIPSVEVSAYYSNYNNGDAIYDSIVAEAETDRSGNFRFSNMKLGRKYNIVLSGCRDNGPSVVAEHSAHNIIKVNIYDWSDLKPLKPIEARDN